MVFLLPLVTDLWSLFFSSVFPFSEDVWEWEGERWEQSELLMVTVVAEGSVGFRGRM